MTHPVEIERKFLVTDDWSNIVSFSESETIRQGYLQKNPTVRVRTVKTKSEEIGLITIKGKTVGITRAEFEYQIPYNDALELLKICHGPLIEKQRFNIPHHDHIWHLDIFYGVNEGLVTAEVELQNEEEDFVKPDWLGREVSYDKNYYNSNLPLKKIA